MQTTSRAQKRARTRAARRERKHEARQSARPLGAPKDATKQAVERLNQRMRQVLMSAYPEDGLVSAPLTVANEYAAEPICEAHGLDRPDDLAGVAEYLTGLHRQTYIDFDPAAYQAWRDESRKRFAKLLAEHNAA